MAQITAMSWNIQKFGKSKYNKSLNSSISNASDALIELIAQVINENEVDIVGLLEINGGIGNDIAQALKNELRNSGLSTQWHGQASPTVGVGNRQEQYVFLWDEAKVKPYIPTTSYTPLSTSTPSFQHQFKNPEIDVYDEAWNQFSNLTPQNRGVAATETYKLFTDIFRGKKTRRNPNPAPPVDHNTAKNNAINDVKGRLNILPRINNSNPFQYIGFSALGDRSPYLGYFQTVANASSTGGPAKIPLAIFHASGPSNNPEESCQSLAYVVEFANQGDTCFIMGDFNIDTQVTYEGYENLQNHNFSSLLDGGASSLNHSAPFSGMVSRDCYSSAYDNAFIRANQKSISTNQNQNVEPADGIEDLIEECKTGGYLELYLMDLENKKVSPSPNRQDYPDIEDAFPVFRKHVSDHMPAVIVIDF